MTEITLQEVLSFRDSRMTRQQEWLSRMQKPLIDFTLNIAGPVKVDAYTGQAFRIGLERLKAGLRSMGFPVLQCGDFSENAGHEWLACVDAPADSLKKLCVRLEEQDELGRLFDMDVLDPEGRKLERTAERNCLVCGKPGRGCASRRIHSVAELQQATRRIIRSACLAQDGEMLSALAVRSLLDEVAVTPKPGLVDCRDSGSHSDMDLFSFIASAASLQPYFQKCFLAGCRTRELLPRETFAVLQRLGLEAERRMYEATGGVNTHKGAIYIFGCLCGAAGRIWQMGEKPDLEAWLSACGEVAGDNAAPGVRQEVAAGLPSVRQISLPVWRENRALCFNDRCLLVLLHLIAHVRDTNMIARGGEETALQVRKELEKELLLSGGRLLPPERLEQLNRDFIASNLSPGGCADLLAATLFVDRWIQRKEN